MKAINIVKIEKKPLKVKRNYSIQVNIDTIFIYLYQYILYIIQYVF